jgi:hypothetical protein
MTNKTTKLRTMCPSWELFKPSFSLVREQYVNVIYLFLMPSLVAALGSLLVGAPTIENDQLNLTQTQINGLILLAISFILASG